MDSPAASSTPTASPETENVPASKASQPIEIAAAIEGMKLHSSVDAGGVAFSQSAGTLPIHQSIDTLPPTAPVVEPKPEFINKDFIVKLEEDAKSCAQNLSHMLGTLQASMNAITALSLQQMQAYQQPVDHLNEAVGLSIVAANELIERVQLLHQQLHPIDTLSAQVRDIKKNLDVLEALVNQVIKQPAPTKS